MAEHLMALELATRMALVGLEVEPDWCLVLICRAIRGVARAFGRSAWLRVLGLCLSRRFQNSNLLCKSEGLSRGIVSIFPAAANLQFGVEGCGKILFLLDCAESPTLNSQIFQCSVERYW